MLFLEQFVNEKWFVHINAKTLAIVDVTPTAMSESCSVGRPDVRNSPTNSDRRARTQAG
jgi:hypothetical protein